MHTIRRLTTTLIMAGTLALPALALADHHDERTRGQQSPAMQNACKGKAPGAAITVTVQDGRKLTGTCQLVFRPDTGRDGNGKR